MTACGVCYSKSLFERFFQLIPSLFSKTTPTTISTEETAMKLRSMGLMLMAVLAVSLLLTGCSKKKPVMADEVPEPPATTERAEEVSQPEAPDTTGDMQPDPLSEDLETANAYAREQGLLGDVYFDFDQYSLKPEARDRLAKNAAFMKEHPEFTFTIEGHCDERGTNEYNLALGERRASAARDYLLSLGASAGSTRTISYGEERPVCETSDEGCWWRNRRAHFKITGRN
jgi:peptidoglycan-associated lipoprotein